MTTATGSAEEAPFLERESPKEDWREVTVETGRKLWTIHGMAQRVLEALGVAQSKAASMAERGPVDFDPFADERRFYQNLLRETRGGGGHGSINHGSSKLGWLITLNIGITLAVSAWVCSTIIEQGKAIAVIECRLNPQCASVVPRGQP